MRVESFAERSPDRDAPPAAVSAVQRVLMVQRWLAMGAALVFALALPSPGVGALPAFAAVAAYDLAITVATLLRPNARAFTGPIALELAIVAAATQPGLGSAGGAPLILFLPPLVAAAVTCPPAEHRSLIVAAVVLASVGALAGGGASLAQVLGGLVIRATIVGGFGFGAGGVARALGYPNTEVDRGPTARLALLNGLLRATAASRDLNHVVAALTATTRRGLRADIAWATLARDGEPAQLWTSGDVGAESLENAIRELARRVGDSGQSVRVGDARAEGKSGLAAGLGALGLRSVLAVPLDVDRRTTGSVGVAARIADGFDSTSLDWLLAIAHQAAPTLRNAHLREIELAQAARLAEIERAKSAFLSGVSHDLRTPLTAVKIAAGLLADQRDDWRDGEESMLASLMRNADRLEKLVDELLDAVRLQGGAVRLDREWVDLAEIARGVAIALRPMLDARDQRIVLDLPEQPALARVDRRRIEQVLTNLLANAQKFGPDGSTVTLALAERGSEWDIAVSDEGPGIPSEDRERVFEPFYRGAGPDGPQSGVGLGLAVARALVDLHGGRIWVCSSRSVGATLRFTLPVEIAANEAQNEAQEVTG